MKPYNTITSIGIWPWLCGFLIAFFLLTCISALYIGPVPIHLSNLWHHASDGDISRIILLHLRLPRILCAITVGGCLALAGLLMQILLRNPLADPYVLGVSGGACVSTLLAMLWGFSGFYLQMAAWLGAGVIIFMVYLMAYYVRGWQGNALLLIGIIMATLANGIISFILSIATDKQLPGMMFWILGEIHGQQLPLAGMIILFFALTLSMFYAPQLEIMSQGEQKAKSLGINTTHLQKYCFWLSAILTASAVTYAGAIGFIGLIVPHLLRLMAIRRLKYLIPLSSLVGASLLLTADIFARTSFSPQQLPIGIFTTLLGAPIFIFLILRKARAC